MSAGRPDLDDPECMDYFCLGADGQIWVLGNHGDWEAADDTARDMGADPIWTFGADTAREWADTLNKELAKGAFLKLLGEALGE